MAFHDDTLIQSEPLNPQLRILATKKPERSQGEIFICGTVSVWSTSATDRQTDTTVTAAAIRYVLKGSSD